MNGSHVSVAIVGSFRKHYGEILTAIDAFASAGCEVTTPSSSKVLDARADFVRLASDPTDLSDVEIELRALDRILRSDVIFVACRYTTRRCQLTFLSRSQLMPSLIRGRSRRRLKRLRVFLQLRSRTLIRRSVEIGARCP
jgi:hypothetical protein